MLKTVKELLSERISKAQVELLLAKARLFSVLAVTFWLVGFVLHNISGISSAYFVPLYLISSLLSISSLIDDFRAGKLIKKTLRYGH